MAAYHINGGLARAAALTPEQRSEIAHDAAKARWGGSAKGKPSLKSAVRQIEKHKAAIARHRDALRGILDDLTAVLESTDDAYESLGYAVDRLSEYV